MIEIGELALLLAAVVAAGWGIWRLWLQPWLEVRRDRARLQRLLRRPTEPETTLRPKEAGPGRVERRLRAAGLAWRPASWIALHLLAGLLVALALLELFPGALWLAVGLGAFAAWLTWAVLVQLGLRRSWSFENHLVDAVDLFVGALDAGENPTQALASAGGGAREPVRTELRELAARLRAGATVQQATEGIVQRFDSEGVRVFTQVLRAKWAVGGDLAPVMRAVNQTLRQRLALRRELRSHLAGAQLSAVLIALLPYLLLPVFYWKRPETLQALWSHPWGPTSVLAAILLQALGLVWLRRILRMEL